MSDFFFIRTDGAGVYVEPLDAAWKAVERARAVYGDQWREADWSITTSGDESFARWAVEYAGTARKAGNEMLRALLVREAYRVGGEDGESFIPSEPGRDGGKGRT